MRAVNAGLGVFFRCAEDPSISVRGKVDAIHEIVGPKGTRQKCIRINKVSDKGIRYVNGKDVVQVEFVLMSTKVVFMARILKSEANQLHVSLPRHLVSINRRKNERYGCTNELRGYFRLNKYRPPWNDFASAPFFDHFAGISGYMSIDDLSLGGICVTTPFPAINRVISEKFIDPSSEILLSMQKPCIVPTEVRWIKRVKEHEKDDLGGVRQFYTYRIGLQFMSMNDELDATIKQFIQQLAAQDAI